MSNIKDCNESRAYIEWFKKWLAIYQSEINNIVNRKHLEIVHYRFGTPTIEGHSIEETCAKYKISYNKLSEIETEVFQSVNHVINHYQYK